MRLVEPLVRRLDRLYGKAHYFVASIALLGTLLIGSSLVAWQTSREHERLSDANATTVDILRSGHAARLAALNALRAERGYLLTEDRAYLQPYRRSRLDLATQLDRLEVAVEDEPESREAVMRLRSSASAFLAKLDTIDELAFDGERAKAIALVRHAGMNDGIDSIHTVVESILEGERVRLRSLTLHVDGTTATLLRFMNLMAFAGICLMVIAVVFALALRRSFARERRYRQELRKLAETDELTGIANRRELLTYLDKRIAEARRTATPLSFAIFDIDNFKRVNDTFGHAMGDEAIKHVVRTAQATVRINDRIGRMGGEEFGIVLPKSSEQNAYMVCERMRGRLNEQPFITEQAELAITISTGIATLTDTDDAASLIERADKALYEAKRSGRDQVMLAA
jgi:diguanylate cyclase (GGDEF)-like protein